MEIQGRLLEIFDEMQVNDRFKKREFVIEYADNPQYPEYIKLECIQDKCNILDNFKIGQDVTVSINLKGRKWTDPKGEVKYFNTLQAWRIEPASDNGNASSSQASAQTPPPATGNNTSAGGLYSAEEEGEDDLPF